MEASNPELRREQPGEEREHGGARLADAGDVAKATREKPAREDARGMVHQDRVHGPHQEPNEGDGDGVLDERGDDPYGYFQPVRMERERRKKRRGEEHVLDREEGVDEKDAAFSELQGPVVHQFPG